MSRNNACAGEWEVQVQFIDAAHQHQVGR